MTNTAISAYPWLCSTTKNKDSYTCYNDDNGSLVSKDEGYNAEAFTTEAYGNFGAQFVYYKVSENLKRDKILGEDQLQVVERAFNIIGYMDQIPPNVRTYQLQGIWGEDVLTCYVGVTAFKYWSTYGEADRNTPQVYDDFQPRIGDIVYLQANDTFYEIRDVKYYQEAFGLSSHTYTLTLRVYKDTKLTIDNTNPTISAKTDPIYGVATWDFPEQYETNDILKNNPILKYEALVSSKNINHMDVLYNPNKGYAALEEIQNNLDNTLRIDYDVFDEMKETTTMIEEEAHELEKQVMDISAKHDEQIEEIRSGISQLKGDIYGLSADIETITYTKNTDIP